MARMVLLEHTLLTGERHFDWLMERPGEPGRLLLAFRVFERVDIARQAVGMGGRLAAERMKDHRRVYLEYEGELTGERGCVKRVGSGDVASLEEGAGWVRACVRWDGAAEAAKWKGAAGGAEGTDRWEFEREV